ncbi:MAG: class I SAM-dependent methyltransferase [Acidimicrobiales bacterium]
MNTNNRWLQLIDENPDHSASYIQRFKDMEAEGRDLDGEARLIDAMVKRNSRILDAGCGPGRVGGVLHRMGHDVVGVDLDPALIAAAEHDHPGPRWITADLAYLDVEGAFDAVVCAGNVVTFLSPETRVSVLTRLGNHLADTGRIVIGFGAGREYEFSDFRIDVAASGLEIELELSTWDVRPFTAESGFLVAVLRHRDRA